jgi:hypothetical protein
MVRGCIITNCKDWKQDSQTAVQRENFVPATFQSDHGISMHGILMPAPAVEALQNA